MGILYQERSCDTSFTAAHTQVGLLVLCLSPVLGAAKPLGQHVRRASDTSGGGGTVSPKIWVSVGFFIVYTIPKSHLELSFNA
jgi:hypothetical protein